MNIDNSTTWCAVLPPGRYNTWFLKELESCSLVLPRWAPVNVWHTHKSVSMNGSHLQSEIWTEWKGEGHPLNKCQVKLCAKCTFTQLVWLAITLSSWACNRSEVSLHPWQATRAYLHGEKEVEAALNKAGFKVQRRDLTKTSFYFSTLMEAKRVWSWWLALRGRGTLLTCFFFRFWVFGFRECILPKCVSDNLPSGHLLVLAHLVSPFWIRVSCLGFWSNSIYKIARLRALWDEHEQRVQSCTKGMQHRNYFYSGKILRCLVAQAHWIVKSCNASAAYS